MAYANISIDSIFYDLGKSREYGEISGEARSVSVSTRLFGKDIITAIKDASKLSPSVRFSEFLLGIVTTLTSGGDLKEYFKSKVRQYSTELNTDVKRNVESLGIMAESFITVGVAFPLILLIIVGVIAALSPGSPKQLIMILYLAVGVIIPVLSALFAFFIRSTIKEVEL
jgi:flagellar protein FlaJ